MILDGVLHKDKMIYLDNNDSVFGWVVTKIVACTVNGRLQRKLHLDGGIDVADVPVASESIQFESDVDVGTNSSVLRRVDGDSRSPCVVDRSSLTVVQLFIQFIR